MPRACWRRVIAPSGWIVRILLVEDDPLQRTVTSSWLEESGHVVKTAANVAQALRALKRDSFDLAILDWMLPDGSGEQILRWVRECRTQLPVMFVTARDEEHEIASMLRRGADDYVVKPLRRQEFLARLEALGRRTGRSPPAQEHLDVGPYRIDAISRTVTIAARPAILTPRMFDVALLLFRRRGDLVSRAELCERFWPSPEAATTRTVDTHMSRIRTALELDGRHGLRLSSVYQQGYRLDVLPAQSRGA